MKTYMSLSQTNFKIIIFLTRDWSYFKTVKKLTHDIM